MKKAGARRGAGATTGTGTGTSTLSSGAGMKKSGLRRDPQFFEREYNARAAVPDHARHIAQWTAQSQHARLGQPCYLDIPYGTEPAQTLDIFPARAGSGTPPVMVFIHGGYWRAMDKSDFSFLAPAFTRAGITLAVINYRLVPSVPLEDLVRDTVAAVTWVYLNAGHYGANPHRLTVCGHSAGGHLAALMLACQWPRWHGALPPDVVRGALGISGLYDLEPFITVPFLKKDLKLTPQRALALSPAAMPPATHAPLLTAVGGDESGEFHRQAKGLAQHWAGVFARDVPMPGHNHFSVCSALGDPASPLFAAARALAVGQT